VKVKYEHVYIKVLVELNISSTFMKICIPTIVVAYFYVLDVD